MTIYCIIQYDTNYKIINSNYKLDDFLFIYRYKIKDTIEIITNDLIHNIKINNYYKITEKNKYMNMNIYCNTFNGFHIIVTDLAYPETSVLILFRELIKTEPDHEKLFNMYQNPMEVDKLYKIKSELEDTKEVLINDISKLLERGETIEDLMIRTAKLEEVSKIFVIEIEKLNKCCYIF